MSQPVSIILPSLDLPELLEANLPPLIAEVERRDVGDEIIVVDDTGTGSVARLVEAHFPGVRALARDENGGFSAAVTAGVHAAVNDMVFSMNTDVRVHPGFLEPLTESLLRDDVGAVTPRVWLHGDEGDLESLTALEFKRGRVSFVQPNLSDSVTPRIPLRDELMNVGFAVGGTLLITRKLFFEIGGLDTLFEPFYWEDIDLSWRIWKRGLRVVMDPRSIVDHMHRGTIGKVVSRDLIRCMQEKNRYAFTWKQLDSAALREHLTALYSRVVDATVKGSRDELVALCYALEELEDCLARREPDVETFADLARRADPRTVDS